MAGALKRSSPAKPEKNRSKKARLVEDEPNDSDDAKTTGNGADLVTELTGNSHSETLEKIDENSSQEDENLTDDTSDKDAPSGTKKSRTVLKNANSITKDIQVAKETAELFRSNIFKLQIDELIKEVKLRQTKIDAVGKFLHKLYDAIQAIESTEPLTIQQAVKLIETPIEHKKFHKVVIPFADPKPTNVNYKLQYLAPKEVELVGSHGLKTGIQLPFYNLIDLNVVMPSELFEKKDYLNYRAFHKRSFYLSWITKHLIQGLGTQFPFLKFHYEYMNNDPLTPTLRLDCGAADLDSEFNFHKQKFSIRLIASFPHDLFDFKKLVPDKNNVRIQADTLPSTPVYNSSLITNCCYSHYLRVTYKAKKQAENFHDAAVLGRLWLLQRGFKSGSFNHGGFGHFEFTMLMALLLKGGGEEGNKMLLSGFSSYQLFKGMIKYIATTDLVNGHLSFHSSNTDDGVNHVRYHHSSYNVPTIFDKTTKLNILWKMSIRSYKMLRHEAQITLSMLNNDVKDSFNPVFLKKNDTPHLKYDIVIEIPIPEYFERSGTVEFGSVEKITFLSYENFIKNRLYTILHTGLQSKLKQVSIRTVDHSIKLHKQISGHRTTVHRRKYDLNTSTCAIEIGLILDQQEAEKLVIKGPSHDDKDASEAFSEFWAGKASLRKFKDNSINLCVIWDASNVEPIAYQIIKYLFKVHLDSFVVSKMTSSCSIFQNYLPLTSLPASRKTSVVNVGGFTVFKTAFENLYKVLTNLNERLPLKIKTLLPSGTAFRYTSPLMPVPFAISSPDFFQPVVLEFESSKNWPDQLFALEDSKTAFLIKIHDLLTSSKSGEEYQCFLQQDKSIPANDKMVNLYIVTPEGYGFKIKVLSERDEILYLRATSNASKDKRPLLEDIYLNFIKQYIGSIKHTRTVTTLGHHFQYLSPVIRLFKLWLDHQLLLIHLSDEIVELLGLSVFVDSESWLPPSGVSNGFLRILYFLAGWNWKEDSIVLDLTKKLDRELESEAVDTFAELSDKLSVPLYHTIVSNFEKVRKSDPNGLRTQFFIGSKDDNSGIVFGSGIPLPIATRLTALARAAVALIESNGVNKTSIDLVFKPALDDYDFVIKCNSSSDSKFQQMSGVESVSSYKNLASTLKSGFNSNEQASDSIIEASDPILEFVSLLNDRYSNIIIFSAHKYRCLSKQVVTGLFNPTALKEKSFKVNIGFNVKLEGDKMVINKDAIYEDIVQLAGDLAIEFIG